jgi:1,4-alpha-glucan branching enzyme
MKINILLFLGIAFLLPSMAFSAADKSLSKINLDDLKTSAAPVETDKGVLFTFEKADASSVSVAGTFNNWDMKKNPLKKNKNGLWAAQVPIPKGKSEYKFVVNEKDWTHDPKNPSKIEDSYGGGFKSTFDVATGVSLGGVTVDGTKVTFRILAPDAKNVSVAGSFNEWKAGSNPMARDDSGFWTITIPLVKGKYQYKYVVNGDQWQTDPVNPKTMDDGFGGSNSVVEVE